jgi:hypothetical protein
MTKKPIAAVAALSLCGGLTYAALPSSSQAAPSTHVRHFVLTSIGTRNLGPTTFAGADRIRDRATGKVVGFDSISGRLDPRTHVATIWVGIALSGGMMHGIVHEKATSNHFHGRVTGGTGVFRHAHGTITGHGVGNTKRTIVTLRFTS